MSSSFPIHSPTTHPSSKNLKALVEMLHDLVDTQKIPHSIIMVGKENKLILCDAYGHQSIEEKTNVICNEGKGKDTINRTFSMTKPILAFTTMVLHEKKILNIDFPITRYMMNNEPYKLDNLKLRPLFGSPEVMQKSFDELPSPAREITIRHLLMHVSGIYPDIEAIYSYITTRMDEEKVTDPQNVLEMFALLTSQFPLIHEPGETWNYALGFDLLGYVISQACNEPLDVVMKKHVFDPLDMNDTGFRIPRENIDRFADMYISTQGRGDNAFMNVSDQMGSGKIYRTKNTFDVPSRFYYGGSEGLITTACDYYKFATCLCNNGLALNGKQIITKETADMMTTNQLPELIKQIPEILTKEDLYNVRKNGSTANINDIELDYFMDPITLKQMGMRGMQFGLGVSILHKPFPDGFGNVGEYGWGGAGSTVYFCDKKEKIVVVFMTELLQGRLNMKRRIKECLYGVSFPKKSRSTKARL